jgi:hypothetical protein
MGVKIEVLKKERLSKDDVIIVSVDSKTMPQHTYQEFLTQIRDMCKKVFPDNEVVYSNQKIGLEISHD